MATLFGDDEPKPEKRDRKKSAPGDPDIAACFALFSELHLAKHGISPHFRGGKDGKHFKDLLAWAGREGMLGEAGLIRKFFGTSDPRVVASDYSVGAFYSLAQHVALLDRRKGPMDRRTVENTDAARRATERRPKKGERDAPDSV